MSQTTDKTVASTITPSEKQAKHPQYTLWMDRLLSYQRVWSPEFPFTPHTLATAGLFYTEKSNWVICFYCGGGFRNLNGNDDLDQLHAMFYGDCLFLQLMKGTNFIDQFATLSLYLEPVQQYKTFKPEAKDIPGHVDKIVREIERKLECPVCMVNESNRVLNCGHIYCNDCIQHLTVCAICNQTINGWTRLVTN